MRRHSIAHHSRPPLPHLLLTAALAMLAAAPAQAEKRIQVNLKHPPDLGNALAAVHVLAGPATGDCAPKFAELLMADLAGSGALVISPQELAALAAQHHLQLPATLDAASASQLAKATGPGALVTIAVLRCEARPIPPFLSGGIPATHISRTEGHFDVDVRFVALADGKEVLARTIRSEVHKDNESQTGVAEHPGAQEVRELVIVKALQDARRLYLPWIEHKEIAVADDKECGVKESFDLLKAGDYDSAARIARPAAEACQSKTAAAAWYNLGVAEMLSSRYRPALEAFDKSLQLRKSRSVSDVRSDCQALEEAHTRPSLAKGPDQPAPASAGPTGILLTNAFIVKLVDGNIAEDAILKMIASQPVQFSLAPEDIQRLKQAGVSDRVVAAMQARK